MPKITPFLWFDEQAEEAVQFYTSIFANGKIGSISRYGDDVPGPKGKVMTVNFQLAGQDFNALNGGPVYKFTPAVSFFVYCQTQKEIDDLWRNLSDGGKELMELTAYPFAERFGWVEDRYGLSWQLSLAHIPQKISPFLMFVGDQYGKAEEALRLYTSLFKNSSVNHIERYGSAQDDRKGAVMHASFQLEGQEFMASDSGFDHAFTFTPAISFVVDCRDQAEVNYFWEKLTEGGAESQCGWLEDRFGVSWQIVPAILIELMSDPDPVKAGRVTQAMLKMSKIEIDALKLAYAQN
jgi:predicted 3-demethylubiquinone-9 3-methyltransferase (glyoxalase superfamily)